MRLTLLALALLGVVGCSQPTKYHADLKVYGNIRTGYLHQIDGAQCRPMGFLLTDSPNMKDFELKLRCSFAEVP